MVVEDGEVQGEGHAAMHPSVRIDFIPVAIDNVGRERTGKDLAERVGREVRVARVHARDVLSAGMADALVDGVVDALVRLGAPVGEDFPVSLYQVAAAVGAAAVDDKPFVVAEGLLPDRRNRAGQTLTVVVVDGDDGKTHHSSHFLITLS